MKQGTTQLNSFNNDSYKVGAGLLKRFLWYVCNMLFFNSYLLPFYYPKTLLLRSFGAQVGKGLVIKPKVNIKYPWKLQVGNHVWIGEQVWIDNLDQVRILDHVCVSQGALILCGNHNYKKPSFDLITAPIILEEGVWIGAQCIVTGGCVCGSHSVLTVGSVASKNLEPYTLYKGNPAQSIKTRNIEHAQN